MIVLPILCVALLIYQTIASFKSAARRNDARELHASAARATDLEQWHSLDC